MPSFGHDAAIELLQCQSSPDSPIPTEVAQLAVKSLTGHPLYLQLLGEELTERAGRPDIAGLKAASQGLLFSRSGRLALFF